MKYVKVHLEADNLSTEIAGYAELHFVPTTEILNTIELELVSTLAINSILINESPAEFIHRNDSIYISFGQDFSQKDTLQLHIAYSGIPNPASTGIFAGINSAKSTSWGNQITWTLSEPFNAKYWWPAKQDLNDKIDSACIEIITPKHLKVGSNGLLQTKTLTNNQIQHTWKTNYPMAYYLLAFTIGEYVEYNNYAFPESLPNDSILIQNYVYNNPDALIQYKDLLNEFPEYLELFSNYYGLYPFHEEKYGHVMAPIGGGMEHQTMSTMSLFTFGLNAHELSHQWFGDYVTCSSWRDIWLNEGFARFSEYLASEKLLSKSSAQNIIKAEIGDVLAAKSGSIYIPESEMLTDNRIFNFTLTYQKGGLFLNMIRKVVKNDDLFFASIRDYLNQYQFKTASAENFKTVLETNTGMNFTSMFEEWYYGEGYPIFDITWQKVSGDSLKLNIQQSTTGKTSLFTTPLEFEIKYQSGQKKRVFIKPEWKAFTTTIPANGTVESFEFDPDFWMIKKVNSFLELDQNGNAILYAEESLNNIIFPNPAQEMIHFTQVCNRIQIFNTSGKLIIERYSEVGLDSVEIKNLQPGLYIIQTEGSGIQHTYKLIKN